MSITALEQVAPCIALIHIPLTTCRSRPGKHTSLILTKSLLKDFKYKLVVNLCISVVHAVRVRAIVVLDVRMRDTFSKVRLQRVSYMISVFVESGYLERVDTEIEEGSQLAPVPLACFGVGKIDNRKAGLPEVPSRRRVNPTQRGNKMRGLTARRLRLYA